MSKTVTMHGACWREERAQAVLGSVALANNEAEFLAVHQPIRDFQITTTVGHSVEPSDMGLLADLTRAETRHAFCVVEGEPGAGKSHLIRWLQVKWSGTDLVMLIERADGSLTGALRQLREQLGDAYAHLFKNLTHNIELTVGGQVRLFHSNLAASFAPDIFAEKLGDEEWVAYWELDRLLASRSVQDHWPGPARILKVMSGDGGQRNSASARFDLDDIVTLARLQSAAEGLSARATMFLRKLAKEAALIETARLGATSDQLLLDETFDIEISRTLLKALNDRRDFAVQRIIGISVDGLKDMFLKLRKELKAEQRRLVLLLEDVTSWEGVDGQLIDSLAVDSRTRADVCDLISVVGMTPKYLSDIQGNYSGRITHTVRLGRLRESGGFQETIQLASPAAQVEFASRYLRAARIGKAELDGWYEDGADPDAIPNACNACASRGPCFAAFGDEAGIGLYPYNRNAITNCFDILEDPKGVQSLQTPRGMIQGVLSPILLNPSRIGEGAFPPAEIEASEWMPERALQPTGFLAQVIDAAEADPRRRDQLRRLMILWGNRSQEILVTQEADGASSVAGIHQGVFQAFGLPWLGEGLEDEPGAAASPTSPTEAEATERSDDSQSGGNQAENSSNGGDAADRKRATAEESGRRTGGGTAPSLSVGKLQTLAEQALAWKNGKSISNSTDWEQLLVDILGGVREQLVDPRPGVWERVFTKENLKLEGMGRVDARQFVLPREAWVARGIEAYLNRRQNVATQPAQRESDLRAIARMLRRLAERVEAHLDRRLAMTDKPWSIAGTIAQILLARAWLRGATSPTAPLATQFEELLSAEGEPRSLPSERVDSWGELLKTTDNLNNKLRALLRTLLELPLGSGAVLLDAGKVAAAMVSLKSSLRTVAVPEKPDFSRGLEDFSRVIEYVQVTDDKLRQLPAREAKRLADRRERTKILLRKATLGHQIKRVDAAVNGAAQALSAAASIERPIYAAARSKLEDARLLDETSPEWLALKKFLINPFPEFESEAARLAFLLEVPVEALRLTQDALEKAEAAVAAAYRYAKAFVDSHQSEGDLSAVSGFGSQLSSASKALLAKVEAE